MNNEILEHCHNFQLSLILEISSPLLLVLSCIYMSKTEVTVKFRVRMRRTPDLTLRGLADLLHLSTLLA